MTAPRQRQARSDDVRRRLLDAALVEFSMHGFEAASTRAIAERAGTHQPQINYHFGSKLALWQMAIDELFAVLDASLGALPTDGSVEETMRELIRRFVRFAADHPELNRLIVQESTMPSERLDWLVERHVAPRFRLVEELCAELDPDTVPTTDPVIFYYSFIGAASLMAVNAPEGERLVGGDPLAGRIDAHADAVATMMLGRPDPHG